MGGQLCHKRPIHSRLVARRRARLSCPAQGEGSTGRCQGAHSIAIRREILRLGSPVEDGRICGTVGLRNSGSEQGQHTVLQIGGPLGEGRKATSTFLCLRLSESGASHAGQMLHLRPHEDLVLLPERPQWANLPTVSVHFYKHMALRDGVPGGCP